MDGHPSDSLPGNRDKGPSTYCRLSLSCLKWAVIHFTGGCDNGLGGLIKTEKTNYVELLLEILCNPVEGANNIILFKLGCCTDDG